MGSDNKKAVYKFLKSQRWLNLSSEFKDGYCNSNVYYSATSEIFAGERVEEFSF